MSDAEEISKIVGGVLFNVKNFPEPLQVHALGRDMSPLNEVLTATITTWLVGHDVKVTRESFLAGVKVSESEHGGAYCQIPPGTHARTRGNALRVSQGKGGQVSEHQN